MHSKETEYNRDHLSSGTESKNNYLFNVCPSIDPLFTKTGLRLELLLHSLPLSNEEKKFVALLNCFVIPFRLTLADINIYKSC